jgi:hypothetical protein
MNIKQNSDGANCMMEKCNLQTFVVRESGEMDRQTAQNLLDNLVGMVEDTQENDYDTALRMGIEALNVQSVRHGHWIEHICELFPAEGTVECSECHEHESIFLVNDKYCPNCGAKMDGEQND